MRGGEDFMEELKSDVLSVTEGFDKEDRKFALDFLRKHVRIDELHADAIDFFKKKKIVFGSGSVNPAVVIVTKDPISADVKKMLENAFDKMGLNESQLYFATRNFVVTRRYVDEREDYFIQLLSMLKAKVIISFDGMDYTDAVESSYINTGISVEEVMDADNKGARTQLNKSFKEIKTMIRDI